MPRCRHLCAGLALLLAVLLAWADQATRVKGTLWVLHWEPFGFSFNDILDASGKVVLVTGASSGLGLYTAEHLAKHGARLIITCRTLAKCAEAKQELVFKVGQKGVDQRIDAFECDQTSLASIYAFAQQVRAKYSKIDSLILNAGIMSPPYELVQGVESQFFVNHVAHVYLTLLLLDLVVKAEPSTIVSVSSLAHWRCPPGGIHLDLAVLNDPANYNSTYYGQSKLANILFAKHLQGLLGNHKVYVNALHPGGVKGGLAKHRAKGYEWLYTLISESLFWGNDEAALTPIALAVGPRVFSEQIRGQYYVPVARPDPGSPLARNETLAKLTWDFTLKILEEKGAKMSALHMPETL